ncbi:LamB/YcsF family protein [Vibrio orientalis CIP 102891 = ATCC 33934]|uniref:5-oxoprolinase subunit A n=1 Tax=Vibrio orientalis CIP 102891 = ATCC 33934 TaxID=675816 RepID=C9QFH9_VIBOR|nr:5-oxoprolinase subunit PxpA [Vibrio orientalis]EEX94015.1 lactam utilization protein LAMB [Vibrio orientalis CIP 102891 = ATCC 33934]EGU52843.1 LamB/YcsF family protein [Vibrio orientalis CIP 102891 = ATCC 33934]
MSKSTTYLNCDMGESYGSWEMGNDPAVMPHIDMANIACGFHAADPIIMNNTIRLAVAHDVKIGAHPSYPDLQGFGRRSIPMSAEEITAMIIYQVGALKALCESHNTEVTYIKPHGALYNDMQTDLTVFEAVVDAVASFELPLMTLAITDNQALLDIADSYNVPLLFEAFADRRYQANGLLAPRSIPDAVIHNRDDLLSQVQQIIRYKKVRTIDGFLIPLEADTICVHGDNEESISMIQAIRTLIKAEEGVE